MARTVNLLDGEDVTTIRGECHFSASPLIPIVLGVIGNLLRCPIGLRSIDERSVWMDVLHTRVSNAILCRGDRLPLGDALTAVSITLSATGSSITARSR